MKMRFSFASAILVASASMWISQSFAASISFQAQVLSDSPYVYHRLNEDSGTTAADTSGNGRTGTYVGGPTLGVAGAGPGSDNAVSFSGTGQHLSSNTTAGFGSLMANSSYEFIFKTTVTNAQMNLGGVLNTGATTAWEVSLNRNAAGSTFATGIRIFLRDDNNNAIGGQFANTDAFDGNFHHLLFTYDSSQATNADRLKAYLDGVPQTLSFSSVGGNSTPGSGTLSNFNFDTAFAARQNRATTDLRLNGTLDEAAIYASTLSADDAAQHYAASLVPEPTTMALFAVNALGALFIRRR